MATGAASVVSASGARPAQAQAAAKTFVLVHGAWHGGWCWRRVADLLEKNGHKVFAPTMTGLGERSHLLDAKVNLATHITDIVNVIKWEGLRSIVLVGHSYGGIIVSGVAEQAQSSDRLDRVPRCLRAGRRRAARGCGLAAGARSDRRLGAERENSTLKPVPAAVFRVNEEDRAWVDAMCTPHGRPTRSALTGARERIARKAYIRAKGYPSVPFDGAQARWLRPPAGASTKCRAATMPWSTCPSD